MKFSAKQIRYVLYTGSSLTPFYLIKKLDVSPKLNTNMRYHK